MKTKKWANVLTISNGRNQKKVENINGKYPIYGSGGIMSYADDYICPENTVIIGRKGSINNPIFVSEKFWNVDTAFGLIANEEILNPKYLYYFCKRYDFNKLNTTVTIPSLTKERLKKIQIPLPENLDDQIRIANLLSQVESLIDKREESIKLLDELLKSTFLDMFGDPVLNPKGWDTKTIVEIAKKEKHSIKRGPFGSALKKEIFVKKGYLVYEQFHALNNDFSMARYFINEENFNELKGFEVRAGDIIISCSGVYLGKLAIVPSNALQGIINQALLKISLDENKMNSILFTYIFTNENFRNKFFGHNRGAGIPNFPPMKNFKKFKFITPPKSRQDKFITIVQQVEQSKQEHQKSLKELKNLFGSLSQRAFSGELDLRGMEIK